MKKYSCPNCNSSGSTQRKCHYCSTNFCTNCKTLVNGDTIKIKSKQICPACGNYHKIHYVDYKDGAKC